MRCATPVLASLSLSLVLAACGGDGPSSAPASFVPASFVPVGKTLTGAAGEQFMTALAQSGITDQSGRLGATTLKAARIDCSTPVVPDAVTKCKIVPDVGITIDSPAGAASSFNTLLTAAGAVVHNGSVGAHLTAATQVKCVRPVVPNPVSTCSFQAD